MLLAGAAASLHGFDMVAAGAAVVAAMMTPLVVGRPLGDYDLWRGSLLFVFLAAVAVKILLPAAAPLLVWPLLAGSVAAAVFFATARGRIKRPFAVFVLGLAGSLLLAYVAAFGSLLFDAIGADLPSVLVLPALLLLPLWMPLLAAAGTERSFHEAAMLLLCTGVGLIAADILMPFATV